MTTTTGSALAAMREELESVGFAIARGHLDPDTLAALRTEADRLVARFTDAGHRSDDYWCYDVPGQDVPMLYRIHNLEKQGAPRTAALFADGTLHRLADGLLGGVRSTVCAMVVKTPGVAGIPWHRDRENVAPIRAINLSVFLDRATAENGCFEAVPGSHLLPDGLDVERTRERGPVTAAPAEPGDVLIHDVRLVHGSGDNTSALIRRSIVTEFEVAEFEVAA